jgi:hypothetical protein
VPGICLWRTASAPAGTILTTATLQSAATTVRLWDQQGLLEHDTVRRDLARLTRTGHNATVFGAGEEYLELERLMTQARLPKTCLRGPERNVATQRAMTIPKAALPRPSATAGDAAEARKSPRGRR